MEHTPKYFITELNDGIQWLTDGHDFGINPDAVPELLEALEEATDHLENWEAKPKNLAYTAFVAPKIARARAAIKAAKGD